MINKKVDNVQVALEGVENGMTIMLGGFGLCGIPENSIAELVKKETTGLTYQIMPVTISVLDIITKDKSKNDSYVGENAEFERQMLSGELDVELIPQGTLAERCRAAQESCFFTLPGGTEVAEGKEVREFNGNACDGIGFQG
jgi:3-oxoacid CoA-transferase subunit A